MPPRLCPDVGLAAGAPGRSFARDTADSNHPGGQGPAGVPEALLPGGVRHPQRLSGQTGLCTVSALGPALLPDAPSLELDQTVSPAREKQMGSPASGGTAGRAPGLPQAKPLADSGGLCEGKWPQPGLGPACGSETGACLTSAVGREGPPGCPLAGPGADLWVHRLLGPCHHALWSPGDSIAAGRAGSSAHGLEQHCREWSPEPGRRPWPFPVASVGISTCVHGGVSHPGLSDPSGCP